MSEKNHSIWKSAQITTDDIMGRCLISTQDFSIGDCLFVEDAFIFASSDVDDLSCEQRVVDKMADIGHSVTLEDVIKFVEEFQDMDKVNCLDTARCFMLIVMYSLEKKSLKNELFKGLTASRVDECLVSVREIRKRNPLVIPKSISNKRAAFLLGVINNNILELEEYGGSGLFLRTCIIQHSCAPNCSFTTSGSTLTMTAIKSISSNTRLSIDYGNFFYHSRDYRQSELLEVYGFPCECDLCISEVDHFRSFVCPYCKGDNEKHISYVPFNTNSASLNARGVIEVDGVEDLMYCSRTYIPEEKGNNKNSSGSATSIQFRCERSNCMKRSISDSRQSGVDDEVNHRMVYNNHVYCNQSMAQRLFEEEEIVKQEFCGDSVCKGETEGADEEGEKKEDVLLTMEKWLEVKQRGVIHDTHELMFWSLNALGEDAVSTAERLYTASAGRKRDSTNHLRKKRKTKDSDSDVVDAYNKAFLIQKRICDILSRSIAVPTVHHERVIYWDKLGQLAVACNRVNEAKDIYQQAYQMSVLASGRSSVMSQKLLLLINNTPKNMEELLKHYA